MKVERTYPEHVTFTVTLTHDELAKLQREHRDLNIVSHSGGQLLGRPVIDACYETQRLLTMIEDRCDG